MVNKRTKLVSCTSKNLTSFRNQVRVVYNQYFSLNPPKLPFSNKIVIEPQGTRVSNTLDDLTLTISADLSRNIKDLKCKIAWMT